LRARIELFALALAALAIAAFAVSFALGVRAGGGAHEGATGTPATPASPPLRVAEPAGRVEVLNAARRAGLARLATDRLRGAGFDVVHFGNTAARDSSVVIDRVGKPELARAVGARLGITRATTQLDSTLFLDATVILGADWPAGAKTGDAAPGEPTGWRERAARLLRRD
jgi:hypothetical protein